MHAPRRAGAKRRPSRGQLSLVPDDGTHAYGPLPRTVGGRLDWAAARCVILDERGGTALRPRDDRPQKGREASRLVVDEPSPAELTLTRLLGAILVA